MAGNVWEWTRSLWGKDYRKPDFVYPYNTDDGREDEAANDDVLRVVRGGSWANAVGSARCAVRSWYHPGGNFSDNININLIIQGDPGAGVLGQSQASYFNYTWAQITAGLQSDRKSADDFTATGAGGSTVNGSADPVSGAHSWWTTRAEAKALGLIPDDLVNDGIVTFGGLYTYDYNAADGIDSGAIDFQGVALHRISEVMGRVGLSGGNVNLSAGGTAANTYSLIDAFSYAGLNARGLTTGPVQQFPSTMARR